MSRQDGGARAMLPHIAWRLEEMLAAIAERRPRATGAIEQALRKVPRHWFVPSRGLVLEDDGARPIDRDDDPTAWWDAVYSGRPIATPSSRDPSSYRCVVLAPSCVVDLLELLDPRPGQRILEVGTGSGWITALLCRLTGESGSVTSVEGDATVAEETWRNLVAAGVRPHLIVGDTARGCPERAPYDRVLAPAVMPDTWVAQARPGAVIVGGNDRAAMRLVVPSDD